MRNICRNVDIQEWLSLTQWSQNPLSEEISKQSSKLLNLKIIDKKKCTFLKIAAKVV
jgi:hypothetical protein